MNAHPEGMARIECTVDGDPRLIAGAAMIVTHVARRAGLASGAASNLADATVQACHTVLESMEGSGARTIRLAASELPNSIEVSVEPVAPSAARRLSSEQFRRLAERVRQTLKSTTDSVSVEVQEGFSRVTLVKNCSAAKHPFAI
jgi:tRNA G26 N,N-dimethylase Trm1